MWSLIVGGTTYGIDNLADIGIGEYDGVGMAPVEYISQQGAQQHGATLRNYRLAPRTVNLVFWAAAKNLADHWTQRDELLRLLLPGNPVTLAQTRPDSTVRKLDCYVQGGLTLGNQDRKAWSQKAGVSLVAFNPLWYRTMAVAGLVATPMTLGATATYGLDLEYGGSVDELPILTIASGPYTGSAIVDPVVTNVTTGDKLDFTGYTIPGGAPATHQIIIDCRWGYKTVQDEAGNNLLGYLSNDSDLTSFCISAARDGTTPNLSHYHLTAKATGGTSDHGDALLNFDYAERYSGI